MLGSLISAGLSAASKAASSYANSSNKSSSSKSNSSSSSSSGGSSGITQTNGGYAYTDKYGFSHVVSDYDTAKQYSGNGQVYNYSGNYGGGYALDNDGNRLAVRTPGAIDYGNDKDSGGTKWASTGLGSLYTPPKVNPVTNTQIKNNLSGLSSNISGSSSPAYASNTWGHDYKVDSGGNVYKNGRLIPEENYKHLPTDVTNYINSAKRANNVGAQVNAQQFTLPTQQMSIEEIESQRVQRQIDEQIRAYNQQLERAMQSNQLAVNQNSAYLNDQLKRLGQEKTVADADTVNLQNRRGGFYSGGLDYQLGQNTAGYNQQQEALRQEIAMRNAEIYDRNRLLAEQASEQIGALQRQAPDLVRERVMEALDRQRTIAIQEAGLTGMYNGSPTMQLQNMQYGMEQDARQAQSQSQAQQLEQLWTASDVMGVIHPQLAQILGIPENTPTMEARKLMLQAEQWQAGFNADQSYRNAQIGIDQQRLNNDMYQFNTNLNNDNYWQGLKYDTNSVQTANKETEKAIKPWIDRIVKSGTYVTKDKSGYLQFNSAQSKEALKDSIFTLSIPENEKKALLQHFGIGPSNFSVSTKGDGRYNNLYKTQQSSKSKTFNQFQSDLGQAIQQTGVPASWAPYLTELFGRESSWNPNAKNPNSTAHGYAQFLKSTRSNYEKKYGIKYDSPVNQLILGIYYVRDRYSDPVKALSFWDKNKWY